MYCTLIRVDKRNKAPLTGESNTNQRLVTRMMSHPRNRFDFTAKCVIGQIGLRRHLQEQVAFCFGYWVLGIGYWGLGD
jgi:hypothetical protein